MDEFNTVCVSLQNLRLTKYTNNIKIPITLRKICS